MMDILMSETCWARKKWNKIASDIKLVCYSSNIFSQINQFINSVLIFISLNLKEKSMRYAPSPKNNQ